MASRVILFDVIETLFSLQPLRDRLEALDLPAQTGSLFFAQLLRDAFALSTAGVFRPFPAIARGTLEVVLANEGCPADEALLDEIMAEFSRLPPHPDVRPALEYVHSHAGTRTVLLTNGSSENTRALLERAGLEALVDGIISIDELGSWKPRAEVYREAARRAGSRPEDATLVAAHAWDTNGALEAGLGAVWVRRQDVLYHPLMRQPRACVDDLQQAARIALEAG